MGVRAAAISVFLAMSVGTGFAQDTEPTEQGRSDESARAFFQAGTQLYEQGEFDEAARQFQLAYDRSGRPQMLYNLYLAHRDAGHRTEAISALERYLAEAESVENRALLEARLETLREESATSSSPSTSSTAGPIILMSSGGALALGAVVSGTLTLRARSDLEDGCPSRTGCDESLRSDRDRGKAAALATDILWPLAAASFGAGLIWLLVGGDDAEELDASFGCTANGCAANARFLF